jgi:hypothetical protein
LSLIEVVTKTMSFFAIFAPAFRCGARSFAVVFCGFVNDFRNYAFGVTWNKPSPLEGEGRVRGALLQESPSSRPSPSRGEGEINKNQAVALCGGAKCIVRMIFIKFSREGI